MVENGRRALPNGQRGLAKTVLTPIRTCPLCGSRHVRRRIMSVKLDEQLIVEGVTLDECSKCGERYLDPSALRQISSARRRR